MHCDGRARVVRRATGADTAAGTRAEPLASIGAALELAAESGKVVIACNATYDERLSVTTGARLYGGFACPDSDTPWAYEDGARAVIAPSATGPVLEIRDVMDAVVIEDVEFDAADASSDGESSIAAIVESSPGVTLRRVRLVAGDAAKQLRSTDTSPDAPRRNQASPRSRP